MKNSIRSAVVALTLALGVVSLAPVPSAQAVNAFDRGCSGSGGTTICKARRESENGLIQNLISILLFAGGVVSIVMIIAGGIKYATSNGDPSRITSAKNTVMYAVVGLVISILAFTIVNFVVSQF